MSPDERFDLNHILAVVKPSSPLGNAWKRGYLWAFSQFGAKTRVGQRLAASYATRLGQPSPYEPSTYRGVE